MWFLFGWMHCGYLLDKALMIFIYFFYFIDLWKMWKKIQRNIKKNQLFTQKFDLPGVIFVGNKLFFQPLRPGTSKSSCIRSCFMSGAIVLSKSFIVKIYLLWSGWSWAFPLLKIPWSSVSPPIPQLTAAESSLSGKVPNAKKRFQTIHSELSSAACTEIQTMPGK